MASKIETALVLLSGLFWNKKNFKLSTGEKLLQPYKCKNSTLHLGHKKTSPGKER